MAPGATPTLSGPQRAAAGLVGQTAAIVAAHPWYRAYAFADMTDAGVIYGVQLYDPRDHGDPVTLPPRFKGPAPAVRLVNVINGDVP